MAGESGERVVIRPESERSQRFAGWLMLGMVSFSLGSLALIAMFANSRLKSGDVPIVVFAGAMMLLLFGGGAVMGMRMAFETQVWVAGPSYFECRSEILGFGWSKTYQATAWRIERLNHNGAYFSLSPVGARVIVAITPFYSTSSASQILKLGRQLATTTGWPLRISAELLRL